MTKRLIEDSEQVYQAWKDAPRGSYLESSLAETIVNDLFPSLLHQVRLGNPPTGFTKDDDA